jgi:hypothetical protein
MIRGGHTLHWRFDREGMTVVTYPTTEPPDAGLHMTWVHA